VPARRAIAEESNPTGTITAAPDVPGMRGRGLYVFVRKR